MKNLFVYGSLMFSPVWTQLLGRSHQSQQAILDGYIRVRIKGHSYPGLSQRAGSEVKGVLVSGLSDQDIEILDQFEGAPYLRKAVQVTTMDDLIHRCDVYLVRPDYQHILSDDPWDPDKFEQRDLKQFLGDYSNW